MNALIAATEQWPRDGVPDYPRGWLIQVEERPEVPDQDDTLVLLFMCCHPALKPADAIALTLRAVGGLTTGEIAGAFLIPEKTMAQRISRAKQKVRDSSVPFGLPTADEREPRLAAVLHVLYLVFNEGYTASTGADLQRADLATEAIRLTRAVHALLADDPEVAGLLALMLLIDARRAARTSATGELVPLAEQDRASWDHKQVTEGIELITATLSRGHVGPYQVQAAINAVHDEAPTADDTDWPQLLALYGVLRGMSDNPMVALAYTRSAPTYWKWPATTQQQPPNTKPQQPEPQAAQNSNT